ncbi:MAG: hypothetical protein HY852_21930 [Bradyrhizobium sp.]|uniref:hypothetical protein n=1 Tax=Bradyrhizobium sp. TaxID=376 RepID=UPI0025BCBD4E|nr:hypothetical protein [Bradyrhizobium sp.]MBI5264464.1 hypothetical protein [Bradyrhizobium sp.]
MGITDKHAVESLIRAIQDQIGAANDLGLDFAVRLLRMALIEVRLNAHQISQAEVEELCSRIESNARAASKQPEAEVISLAEVALKRRF